jgi:hypothetical protein
MTGMPGLLIAVLIIGAQILLPCYLAYETWRGASETRSAWCLSTVASAAYIGLVFLTGRWDLIGYYLRFVVPALFLAAAVAGYVRARVLPWSIDGQPGKRTALMGSIGSLVLFSGLLLHAVRGLGYDGEPVHLAAPLRGGAFYVGQGGDSPLVNYHNTHATQRYAMDILELNGAGMRAASLYPSNLGRYRIFGRTVHSPCDGTIVATRDGLADNIPPRSDRDTPPGNHVIVACHGVRVLLAHLQNGSVSVQPGSSVSSGDIVGRVGNSGNTSEPHLHVHAVRGGSDNTASTGIPVPILFDGTFAVRNTILGD